MLYFLLAFTATDRRPLARVARVALARAPTQGLPIVIAIVIVALMAIVPRHKRCLWIPRVRHTASPSFPRSIARSMRCDASRADAHVGHSSSRGYAWTISRVTTGRLSQSWSFLRTPKFHLRQSADRGAGVDAREASRDGTRTTRSMSERTLHTYGALLDEAKRTNVGVDELGSTLATSSARAREDAMRGRDEEDPGVRSKRQELEEMVYIEEALENEEKTPIARARECAGRAFTAVYTNLWLAFVTYVILAIFGLQRLSAAWNEPGFKSFVDCIYFIAITVTTVGYGDISPVTNAGKVFMIVFIIVGIALATILISKITNLIVEAKEATEIAAQKKMTAQLEKDLEVLHSKLGAMMNADDIARFTEKAHAQHSEPAKVHPVLRVIFHPLGVITAVILIGAATFHSLEGVSYLDGVWWAVVTSTTVGYGDILPETDGGKIFSACYAFFVVGVMGWAVSNVASDAIATKAQHEHELRLFTLSARWLAEQGGDKGYVDKVDFIRAMLVARGVIDKDDFNRIASRFDMLDINGDGTLDVADLLK